MLKSNYTNHSLNQRGVVSILVSVIIMIILTLTAVSFAQLMRREQRQSLDRQLSAQAYYAAESAINDTIRYFAEGEITDSFDDCQAATGPLSGFVISDELGVSYSCVTVDTNLTSLVYDNIQMDATEQVQVNPHNEAGAPQALNELIIQWEGNNGTAFAPDFIENQPQLPRFSDWPANRPGMLRVEITPILNAGTSTISRDVLMNPSSVEGRKVFFLYPASVGGTDVINWGSGLEVHGKVVSGNCNASDDTRVKDCQVTINNLPTSGVYSYIVRAKAIYRPVSMFIEGNLTGGSQAYFKGAQVAIDATGKANDVLRRIRAVASVDASAGTAEFPLQSYEGICKRLSIVDDSDVRYPCL